MMWNEYGMTGWGVGAMMFAQLLIWLLLIGGGVVFLSRVLAQGRGQQQQDNHTRSAEEIVAERYARGEIEDDEYRRRLEELRRG